MSFFFSAAAALIPMIIYMIIIWHFDKYDREPVRLVLKNYLWGAVGAVILSLIFSGLFSRFFSNFVSNPDLQMQVDAIIAAPFIEEVTKGIFLLIIISDRRIDNITDGIVYGGAIGLGFGTTENFLYFISYSSSFQQWISVVLIRTFFSAVMHCIATASLGAFLSYAKLKKSWYRYFLTAWGITTAVLIHLIWNFSVSSQYTAVFGLFFIMFSVLIFSAVFTFSISSEKKIIFSQLFDEAKEGLIPAEHLTILNSSKRNGRGWVDEKIRKLYIKAATTLAFRKMQFKNASGIQKDSYAKDVELYRNYIRHLLNERETEPNET